MKIVALHTDFRIYWTARLNAFNNFLIKKGDQLSIIEIAGKGSPYAFAGKENTNNVSWEVLYPNSKPEELSGNIIKSKLFKRLDEINPDVVLAGAIAFPSGALAVQWANSRKNKRVVIFDDAKLEAVQRNPIVNFIKQSVYNGVDAMFYPAETWIPTGKFWKFKPEQMFFGVDVVDNDFWSKTVYEKPFDFEYFVAVGRQIPEKNYCSVMKAYHEYCKRVGFNNAIKFVLIGNGPERQTISNYISNNKLDSFVYMKEFMPQNELRGIYQHASALFSCSRNETWGLVINEAMCCGCAIVASNECGATDILVHDSINGFRVDCNNTQEIADAMFRYHNLTSNEKSAMSQSSRNIISEWGLDRFCQGAYNACLYAVEHPKIKPSLISKLIINKWYGRYKPV